MRIEAPEKGKSKKKVNINRIFVIIAAAGLGTRMESDVNKQIMEIDGVSVIERTLDAFKAFSEDLAPAGITLRAVIVTSDELVFKINGIVKYKKYGFVQNVVAGGESRMESVWNGIEAIADLPFPPLDNDIVFIHDGARCLVDQPTLERCLEGAIQYDICAAAVPVKSTIKQTKHVEEPKPEPVVEEKKPEPKKSALGLDLSKFPTLAKMANLQPYAAEPVEEKKPEPPKAKEPVVSKKPEIKEIKTNDTPYNMNILASGGKPVFKSLNSPISVASSPEVVKTPDRKDLMEVQTPQVFRYDKLVKSYINGITKNIAATDDTSLAEALNYKVHLVEGSYTNIKITTKEDIDYAEMILKRQAAESRS